MRIPGSNFSIFLLCSPSPSTPFLTLLLLPPLSSLLTPISSLSFSSHPFPHSPSPSIPFLTPYSHLLTLLLFPPLSSLLTPISLLSLSFHPFLHSPLHTLPLPLLPPLSSLSLILFSFLHNFPTLISTALSLTPISASSDLSLFPGPLKSFYILWRYLNASLISTPALTLP